MKLVSSVHVRRNYNNAFWNRSQMAYGDGSIFVPLTRSLSVIGHELSHGVVQLSGGLVYTPRELVLSPTRSRIPSSSRRSTTSSRRPFALAEETHRPVETSPRSCRRPQELPLG